MTDDYETKRFAAALECLEGYEQLEADIIDDNRCWAPEGMASTPRLTQEQWDRMTELQTLRNRVLGRFGWKLP